MIAYAPGNASEIGTDTVVCGTGSNTIHADGHDTEADDCDTGAE